MHEFKGVCCQHPGTSSLYSSSRVHQLLVVSIVTIGRLATGGWVSDSAGIRVSIMKRGKGLQLQFVQLSPTTGYIQTPDWGNSTLRPKSMNSVIRVEVPETHRTMVTMLHMSLAKKRFKCDTSKMTLVVYETEMARSNIVWLCRFKRPVLRTLLPRGANLFVHFKCRKSQRGGFRLFFSSSEESAVLRQLDSKEDVWNCSVPNFADLKPHFPCDLRPQCFDKADERNCPYFSEDCGLGFITVGNHCLLYVVGTDVGTWRGMEFECDERGMRMANFKRREDYETIMQYLKPVAAVFGFNTIAVGIRTASTSLPMMYWNEMQNSDGSIAFYKSINITVSTDYVCGFIKRRGDMMKASYCTREHSARRVLCEIQKNSAAVSPMKVKFHRVSHSNHSRSPFLTGCPTGHLTMDFLACDVGSACWSREVNSCPAPLTPLPPSFTCANGLDSVPYTLVCDVRPDCSDGSDETFCVFLPCALQDPFHCSDRECVSWSSVCDGQKDCHNAADEELCSNNKKAIVDRPIPPAIVRLNRHGRFSIHKLTQSQLAGFSPAVCPETHFHCPNDGYCMPVFLRCNKVYDCVGREDEMDCGSYTCPGYYRCRNSQVCLHPDHLCDGIFQCPHTDDELLCDLTCPTNCTCYGLAFHCRQPFLGENVKKLRFLDSRDSGVTLSDLKDSVMLIYLSVAENGLTTVGELNFPNLHTFDLSNNQLSGIPFHELSGLPQLETLYLSGNPLLKLFSYADTTYTPTEVNGMFHSVENVTSSDTSERNDILKSLRALDLSRVKVSVLNTSFLSLMPNLRTINMSGSGVDTLLGEGFRALSQLRVLDLSGCRLSHFPRKLILELNELETVFSETYKLCCPATLPTGFLTKNCHAPPNKLSSCEALLGFSSYRVFSYIFGALALLGNVSSFFYRVFLRQKRLLSCDVFWANLCAANFLMGVYLSAIAVADRLYLGTYLWEDNNWRNSAVCQVVGFLSLVPREVSVLVLFLFTVDILLSLRFPFSTFHFGARSSQLASLCAWGVGCFVAAVPLVPDATRSQFYGETGICTPLPVHIANFPVLFGVLTVTKSVFYFLIVVGQVFIHCLIHSSSVNSVDLARTSQNLTIAQRLIPIAMSDFLCWFPVGLVGYLAAMGTPISEEINVATSVFVLPLHSALNPFLYTLNVAMEKLRTSKKERIMKRLVAQFGCLASEDKLVSTP